MKVSFLGTNGWFDTQTGNTICVLVETKESYTVFDAGNGFYKLSRYIKGSKPLRLFLSHYHLDHVIGLHVLNKFHYKQGLDVYGPPGLKLLFNRVINRPYTIPISDLPMKLRLHELSKNSALPEGLTYLPLRHSALCYGYRLCSGSKTIAYCTDTGICGNLYRLAANTDLFISECSLRPGQETRSWPHLNPESAAKAALKAGANKLALIHFDASLYPDLNARAKAVKASRQIFKNSFSCKDDMSLVL